MIKSINALIAKSLENNKSPKGPETERCKFKVQSFPLENKKSPEGTETTVLFLYPIFKVH